MELEIEFDPFGTGRSDCVEDLRPYYHYLIFKEETSIRHGIEIVTHPMNLVYHYLIMPKILQTCVKSMVKYPIAQEFIFT